MPDNGSFSLHVEGGQTRVAAGCLWLWLRLGSQHAHKPRRSLMSKRLRGLHRGWLVSVHNLGAFGANVMSLHPTQANPSKSRKKQTVGEKQVSQQIGSLWLGHVGKGKVGGYSMVRNGSLSITGRSVTKRREPLRVSAGIT